MSGLARQAGFQGGDIVLGLEGQKQDLNLVGFMRFVEREYLVGDTLRIEVIREGKRMTISLVLKGG